jgi:hypothetical protein
MSNSNLIINNQVQPFISNGTLVQADDELRDIKGFQQIIVPDWLWWSLLVLLLVLLAWLIYRYWLNRSSAQGLSFTEQIINSINALDLNANSKEFYLLFSELSRSYLELRLGLHLMDKTAEELKPILVSETKIPTNQALALTQIFARADLAKFAKQEYAQKYKQKDREFILSLIDLIENTLKQEEEKKHLSEIREDNNDLR